MIKAVSFLVAMSVCIVFAAASRSEESADFPLLADIPERPAQVSRKAGENERDYRELVSELEAGRRDMLQQLEQLRRMYPEASSQGGK